jgi:hypothetical protein
MPVSDKNDVNLSNLYSPPPHQTHMFQQLDALPHSLQAIKRHFKLVRRLQIQQQQGDQRSSG